jgi:N-acetylglucosamine-6-phosphate deacetylase
MPEPPRYFDLQVNGYAGVDFNRDDLTPEGLHKACALLGEHGVAGVLATVITDDMARMTRRLSNLAALRERDALAKKLIAGLHIEGPFINPTPGYVGAHPADAVKPANADDMNRLLDAAAGLAKLVTLAPECDDGFKVTRMLAGQGFTVSAGHCNPSVDQLRGAIDAGLTMFTHLGNGCPMQMHRHDNIIQRVLSLRGRLWVSFIGDGAHVPMVALGNYLRLVGSERAIMVTDAIAPAGLGPGRYTLGRWDIHIGPDMVARAPDGSHLLGAAITMPQTAANLTQKLGLSADEVRRLMDVNPRAAIGMNGEGST